MNNRIHDVLMNLRNGNNIITNDDVVQMNSIVSSFLNDNEDLDTVRDILEISNILYNNTSNTILPLEDGVYDLTVTKYNSLTNGKAPVGALPVSLSSEKEDDLLEQKSGLKQFVTYIPDDTYNKMLYFNNITHNEAPIREDFYNGTVPNAPELNKLKRDATHLYPDLVGTLYKCKFVLLNDAKEAMVDLNDSTVSIFERDFFASTYTMAMNYRNQYGDGVMDMVAELKYDGVSIEAEVCGDTIVSAGSRGDTANDVACDYTPIFAGKKFYRATGRVPDNTVFGIKFEAIITEQNMEVLANVFHKKYKNCRVAIIGILGSSDAIKYRDLITLVPIKSEGLPFNDTIQELNFLNQFYSSGVNMKYIYIKGGDYYKSLYQVKHFVDDAESMRPYMPFMYDGVVVSYIHPIMKQMLGRANSIDLWSMAIKFNALSKTTTFLGYKYTIGQNGLITPMAYFIPVEFLGSVHNKTTVHSYKRFRQLGLRKGDIVRVTYVNDVICYLTKPYTTLNDHNKNPIIEFPETCPSCGMPLQLSDSEDSVYCTNPNCPEKNITRVTNMLSKLGVKDFSRATIEKLHITGFTSLMNLDYKYTVSVLGEVLANKLFQRISNLKNKTYPDYKIVGSIGFSSISQNRWMLILNNVKLEHIINASDKDLYDYLIMSSKGIGSTIANVIISERSRFIEDLKTIASMSNVQSTYRGDNLGIQYKKQIRFTGFRSKELEDAFNALGFDADGSKSVTKKTYSLIIPYYGFQSSKLRKVSPECRILSEEDAWNWIKSMG